MDKTIVLGIKDERDSYRKIEYGKGNKVSVNTISHETDLRPGKIVSRLDHPVTLSYNGETIIIPPKGSVRVADVKKIGAMPRGVVSLIND